MGNLSINTGGITTNKEGMPSIDLRYGPYESVSAAHAALSTDGLCAIGLTVGIINGNKVDEYWYQEGIELNNLVKKQSDAYTKQESDNKYQPAGDYATKTELDNKVDNVPGKGLSTNDYTNEEKQKVGNALVPSDIAGKADKSEVYTKSETYNKTELNNMITTPNQQYVTVTATAQTTAVTDLLPATGAADTIYRVGNWDGTQYDDTCYSEYAWKGDAYVKLHTKNVGIDDEPATGSDKLPKSGGVMKLISEYESVHALSGKDMEFVKIPIKNIYAKKIAILFENPNWSVPQQSVTSYLRFGVYTGIEETTEVFSIPINNTIPDEPLYITFDSLQKDIAVGCRASSGTTVKLRIVNLDVPVIVPDGYLPVLSDAEKYAFKHYSEIVEVESNSIPLNILNPENITASSEVVGRIYNGKISSTATSDTDFKTYSYNVAPGIYYIHGWQHGNISMYSGCMLSYNGRAFAGFSLPTVGEYKRMVRIPFNCTIQITDKINSPIGCEVVKINDTDTISITGNADQYVETIGRKIYAGKKYSIQLDKTSWEYGMSYPAGTVFLYGYYTANNEKVKLLEVPYSSKDTIKNVYTVAIPDDVAEGARLFIGGRCLNGTTVTFRVKELFYDEDTAITPNKYTKMNLSALDKAKINSLQAISQVIEDTEDLYESEIIESTSVEAGRLVNYGVRSNLQYDTEFNTYSFPVDAGLYRIHGWKSGDADAKTILVLKDGEPYMDIANGVIGENTFAINIPIDGSVIKLTDKVESPINCGVRKLLKNLSFTSPSNDTYAKCGIFNFKNLANYRLVVENPNWPKGNIWGGYVLQVGWTANVGDNLTNLVMVYKNPGSDIPEIKDHYDFVVPAEATYLQIGGRGAAGVEVKFKLINLDEYAISEGSNISDYGIIGKTYPDEMVKLEALSSNVNYPSYGENGTRFHFLHISDNHNGNFGKAEELLDLCPAQFLVNTGDMLFDKLADATNGEYAFQTIDLMNIAEKPVYLVPGNHDYCIYEGDGLTKQDVFNTFTAPMNTHNGTSFDKTYYKVDFPDSNIRCLMLDQNDGWSNEELVGQGPTNTTYNSKMSADQINWLITQLQDAATNGIHVCLFIHRVPIYLYGGKYIDKFVDTNDYASWTPPFNYAFLLDIVQGFIDGQSGTVTHEGNTYNYSFNNPGNFVGWFAGHTHYDVCGYPARYPKQLMVHVTQPFTGSFPWDGTANNASARKMGVHFNYVTVDTIRRRVSILRIGDNISKYGEVKDGFSLYY